MGGAVYTSERPTGAVHVLKTFRERYQAHLKYIGPCVGIGFLYVALFDSNGVETGTDHSLSFI